jgi:3-hydroxyacyl-[acyl-carrier-protein] dehydratase
VNHLPAQEKSELEPIQTLAPEVDAHLREVLKHCSPSTYYAAHQFLANGDGARLPAMIVGLVERYVPADRRDRLRSASDALRLNEDLGVDSLSLIELGLLAEDVLRVAVTDEEMKQLRTLGDVRRLTERKVGA